MLLRLADNLELIRFQYPKRAASVLDLEFLRDIHAPVAYIQFVSEWNGGELSTIDGQWKLCGTDQPVSEFFGVYPEAPLNDIVSRIPFPNTKTASRSELLIDKKFDLLPIGSFMSDCVFYINLGNKRYPHHAVVCIDFEEGLQPSIVAESFIEFLNSIVLSFSPNAVSDWHLEFHRAVVTHDLQGIRRIVEGVQPNEAQLVTCKLGTTSVFEFVNAIAPFESSSFVDICRFHNIQGFYSFLRFGLPIPNLDFLLEHVGRSISSRMVSLLVEHMDGDVKLSVTTLSYLAQMAERTNSLELRLQVYKKMGIVL